MTNTHFLTDDPNPTQHLRGVLCTTASGDQLQLLFSVDRLLDLAAVERIVGGHLTVTSGKPITLDIGGQSASCPMLSNAPAMIDSALAAQGAWQVDTELGFVEMAQEQLLQHLPRTAVHDMTLRLSLLDEIQNEVSFNQKIENLTGRRVRKRLDETLEMPPLPHTATEIIRLKLDPDAGLDELAQAVETDPSLAAQVVSWANSPYYAAPGVINSVSDAVIRVLGYDMVINLALGLSLGKSVTPPKGRRGEPSFWTQSIYCAALMETLAKTMDPSHRPNVGLAYLSGLLFNFGQLVLSHVFPALAKNIGRYQQVNAHLPPRYVDRHLLTLGREQLGAELLASWRLPEPVCDALRHQHQPDIHGDHATYSRLLFVATRLLAERGYIPELPSHIPEATLDYLGLTPNQVEAAVNTVIGAADSLDAMAKDLER